MPQKDLPPEIHLKDARLLISVTKEEKARLGVTAAKLGVQAGPLARALLLRGLDSIDQADPTFLDSVMEEQALRRRQAGIRGAKQRHSGHDQGDGQ